MQKMENFCEQAIFENQSLNSSKEKLFTSPPKILLVEDTKIIQMVHQDVLNDLGCHVTIASTGYDALMMFKEGYDLIFLDVGLPDLRGSAVAEYIRHLEKELKMRRRNILIALTAYGDDVKEECLAAGMDDLYSKPITREQLKDVLLEWLPVSFIN